MGLKTNRKLFIILFLLTCQLIANAQFNVDIASIADRYSTYNGVFLEDSESYIIDIKGDSLVVTQDVKEQFLVLTNNVIQFANDRVYYSSFSRINNLDAKSYIPSGKGYKTEKVRYFQEGHSPGRSIFYDDVKSINFSFPSLEPRSVTSVSYEREYLNPRFLGSFYFREGLPTVTKMLSIKAHKDVNIDFSIINGENADIKQRQYSKGKYNYYEWTASHIKAEKTDNVSTYFLYYSPHIIYYITDYTINGVRKTLYKTPKELYDFYYDNISMVSDGCTDELGATAKEICSGKNTDMEKAAAILYWVQDNIKYVAFEEGMRGFVPDSPGNVLHKRFGDCKDMSSLIRQLAICEDVDAYYCWVGTDDIPYTYDEVPTVSTDNHMVAALNINDSLIVLDGTTDQLELGIPPARLQGKELLVGVDKETFRIVEIPTMPSSFSRINDSCTIQIKGSSIFGTGIRKYEGYNRWELAHRLDGVEESKVKKSMINVLARGSNKFFLDSVTISPYKNRESIIDVNYDFHVDEYISNLDSEIYLNPNVDRDIQGIFVDSSKAEIPVVNDFKFIKSYTTYIQVPEGYKAKFVPENSRFDHKKFGYSIAYEVLEDQIVLNKDFRIDFKFLEIEDFNAWNDMVKKLGRAYRETIVFEKINNTN